MTKALWIGLGIAVLISTAGFSSSASAQSCNTLRQACLMKDSLGEQGQGNCKRFRAQCGGFEGGGGGGIVLGGGGGGINMGGGGFGLRCEKLRLACMLKEPLGLQGLGVCKAFRNECT